MDRREMVKLGAWAAPVIMTTRLVRAVGSGAPLDPGAQGTVPPLEGGVPYEVPARTVDDGPGSGRGLLPYTGAPIAETAVVAGAAVVVGGTLVAGAHVGEER